MEVPVAARELPWYFDDFFRTLDWLENDTRDLRLTLGSPEENEALRRFSGSVTEYGLHVIMLDSIQEQLEGSPSDTGWKSEWSDNIKELVIVNQKLAQFLYSIRGEPSVENIDNALDRISAIRTATLYVLFGAGVDPDGWGGGDRGDRGGRRDFGGRDYRSRDYDRQQRDWSDMVQPRQDEWREREQDWRDQGGWDRYEVWEPPEKPAELAKPEEKS